MLLLPSNSCFKQFLESLSNAREGGSPGLVVMGDNSCSKGRGFEWMDIFSHLFVVKIVMFV